MSDVDEITSKFLALIGFREGSAQHALLLDATEYFITRRNIEFISDFSSLSTQRAVIMAFSFGLRPNDDPGATNIALAAIINKILDDKPGFPVFAQWEIADALRVQGRIEDFRAVRKEGYLSTRGVLDQFCQEFKCLDMNVESVILVAHPDHIFRCKRLIEKRDLNVTVPRYCLKPPDPWQSFGCDDWGYDPMSTQYWTTNRSRFILHELSSVLRTL